MSYQLVIFWHQSDARTAATFWNWSGKTLSPGALLAVLYFSSCHLFFRPLRLFLVPTICPWVSEDGILQTMLLGYTTLATVSFDLPRCVPLGLEKLLFYDGNVKCFQWWQCILITFVCAFFVPFVFALFWGCYKLYSR